LGKNVRNGVRVGQVMNDWELEYAEEKEKEKKAKQRKRWAR
jgi:hypothetical protein